MAAVSTPSSFSSGSNGGEIALWSNNTGPNSSSLFKRNECVQAFTDSTKDNINSISWNASNTLLACAPTRGDHVAVLACDDDQKLTLANRIEPKSLLETGVTDGVGGVTSCCFHGNGHQLLIGLSSPVVALWDTDTSTVIRNYVGHSSGITCLTRNVKDSFIVSGCANGSLTVHKVSSSQPVTQFNNSGEENNESIVCVRFSPSEHAMVGSCDNKGTVKLWSVESQRLLTTFSSIHSGGANDIAFSPYNRMLMASVGMDKLIYMHDLIQRKTITQVNCPVAMLSLLLLKDGLTMIGGGVDGNLYIYNMRNCKEASHVIPAHSKPITALSAQNTIKSRTGRKLPTRSHRKKVTIDPSVSVVSTPDNGAIMDSVITPSTGGNTKPSHDNSLFSPLTTGGGVPSPLSSDTLSISTVETPLHHVSLSSSMAGIFSPLETNSHMTNKTRPLLVSSQSSPSHVISPSTFPIDSTLQVNPTSTSSTLLVSSNMSSLIQPKVQSTPTVPNIKGGRGSPNKKSHTPPRSPHHHPATSRSSPVTAHSPQPTHSSQPAHAQGAPPTSLQLQFMENILKDQQEDIIWNTHRDISNLSVTMLRQFATLQNQMIVSLTAISEKVDKLTDEVESLKLQVQHFAPKY